MVRISEDIVELIYFGPRYELDDSKSTFSEDGGSACGGRAAVPPDDNS